LDKCRSAGSSGGTQKFTCVDVPGYAMLSTFDATGDATCAKSPLTQYSFPINYCASQILNGAQQGFKYVTSATTVTNIVYTKADCSGTGQPATVWNIDKCEASSTQSPTVKQKVSIKEGPTISFASMTGIDKVVIAATIASVVMSFW
jgi:hypothetical protein